jgi:hypothetical protein
LIFSPVRAVEDIHGKIGAFGTKEQLTMVQIEERVNGWKVIRELRKSQTSYL